MLAHNSSQDPYNFSAEPRVVQPRSKFRPQQFPQEEEEEQIQGVANIMWDKRVVRGNTYAAIVTTSREATQQLRGTQPRMRKTNLKPLETAEMEAVQADVSTPRPVDGRKHCEIQTDENVELLTDKPPEYEKDTQTDFYIDRPVNRLFMPQKIGEDRETQIWDGELFNFDYEVEPILQVLIGKTLENGRMEVLEEEELRVMKEEQKRYDELRYAEMAEAQRMEAEERRKLEESERRKKQHKLKKDQSVTSHQKLISRIMAKEYLKTVRFNGFNILREQGTFQNAFDFEFNNTFLPWIFNDVLHLQQGGQAIANTIGSLNNTISQNLADMHAKAVYEEQERRRLAKEERERIEKETQERRAERAEKRKIRAEEQRKKALQDKIAEVLMAKGEQRQNVLAQVLSDLDAFGREGMTVGLVGGVIGELWIALSTIESLKNVDAEDPLAVLNTIEITKESIQKIVENLVTELVAEGKIEVGVTGEIEAQLQEIDPELTLENLHTKTDKANEIRALLSASISSHMLRTLQANSEELGLNNDYLPIIVDALINEILNPDEKSLRNVKVVKATIDYSQETKYEALAVLLPTINEETPIFNLAEAKGIKPQKKKKDKESMQNLDEGAEEVVPQQITHAEADFDDAVTVFPLASEDLRVLVSQRHVAIVLRRELLLFMSSLFKELDMKEIEVLKKINDRAEHAEEIVSRQFHKPLTILTFDKN